MMKKSLLILLRIKTDIVGLARYSNNFLLDKLINNLLNNLKEITIKGRIYFAF